jgi:hypothetical protein
MYAPAFVAVQLDAEHVAPVPAPLGAMAKAVVDVTYPRSPFEASNARTVYDRGVPAVTVAAVASMTMWSGAPAITVSVAVPLTPPPVAVIVYVPAAVVVQVAVVPLAGAQVAPGLADQVGAKPETPLRNASMPVAVNPWLPPATIVAVAGSSLMLTRSDATTVRVAVAVIAPLDAVMV